MKLKRAIKTNFPNPVKADIMSVNPMVEPINEEPDRERPLRDDEMAKALLEGYDCTRCRHAALCEMYDEILKHEKICENFQKRNSIFFMRPVKK